MKQRTPDKEDKEWFKKARQVGCIVCVTQSYMQPFDCPEEHTAMHHIDGKTKNGSHLKTIPLCPYHHQDGPNARHVNKTRFVGLYGSEEYLLEKTKELVEGYFES